MLLPKPYLVVSAWASGLLSPLPQRALWWICSVWLPVVPDPWACMMLICPQSLWLPPQPGTVSHSIHFLCTPRPGLHTSPSFSHRQLPVPPPMALSARSVPLTSQLQTTAPHLVLCIYICILPFVCSRDMLQLFGKGLIGFLWKYVSNSHRMHL